jgi:hypothetical protein
LRWRVEKDPDGGDVVIIGREIDGEGLTFVNKRGWIAAMGER